MRTSFLYDGRALTGPAVLTSLQDIFDTFGEYVDGVKYAVRMLQLVLLVRGAALRTHVASRAGLSRCRIKIP